jgi:hypothetical protein
VLLREQLAAEQDHADAVAQGQPLGDVSRAGEVVQHARHDPPGEALGRGVAGRGQPARRLGGELAEEGDDLGAHSRVVGEQRGLCLLERRLRRAEFLLEGRERPPGHPAVTRRLEEGFGQLEAVGVVMQRRVGTGGGAHEGQPVAVGQEAAARRVKRDPGVARQGHPERVPVEAAVEEPETARVHIHEDALLFQRREVEGQALDLGWGQARAGRSDAGALRHRSVADLLVNSSSVR